MLKLDSSKSTNVLLRICIVRRRWLSRGICAQTTHGVRLVTGMQAVGQEWHGAGADVGRQTTRPSSPPGLERLLTRPVAAMAYLLQPPRSVPSRLLTSPPLRTRSAIFFLWEHTTYLPTRAAPICAEPSCRCSHDLILIKNNYNIHYVT